MLFSTLSRNFTSQLRLQTTRRFYSSSRPPRYVRFATPASRGKRALDPKSFTFRLGATLAVVGAGTYLTNLEQVPETGRWRFMGLSKQSEQKMEKEVQAQVLKEFHNHILPTNHPLTVHARKVASRIISSSNLGHVRGATPVSSSSQHSNALWTPDERIETSMPGGLSDRQWEVIVINDKNMVNAFAVPGLVAVATGILPICQDEEGLAAILGHEIGHVVLRHSAEKASSNFVMSGVLIVLAIMGLDFGMGNMLGTLAYELPNSRKLEYEADQIGLKLMSKACYDPQAAPEVFKRLHKLESGSGSYVPALLRTHPLSDARVIKLQQQLPEAYQIMASNEMCSQLNSKMNAFQHLQQQIMHDGDSFGRW